MTLNGGCGNFRYQIADLNFGFSTSDRNSMNNQGKPRIVIIGAGFGGLSAALTLAEAPVDVLLMERNSYHTFLALLNQVAAAEVEPEGITYPIRSILRKYPSLRFMMGEADHVDFSRKVVKKAKRKSPTISLSLPWGIRVSLISPGPPGMPSPLRRLMMECDSGTISFSVSKKRCRRLGGGAAKAAHLCDCRGWGHWRRVCRRPARTHSRTIGERLHPQMDFHEVRVLLIQGVDSLLPDMPEALRMYALTGCSGWGLKPAPLNGLQCHAWGRKVAGRADHTDGDRRLDRRRVRGRSVQEWGSKTRQNGQVDVLPTLQIPGHPEVYCIGDLAYGERDGGPLPMVAPVAIQDTGSQRRRISFSRSGVGNQWLFHIATGAGWPP